MTQKIYFINLCNSAAAFYYTDNLSDLHLAAVLGNLAKVKSLVTTGTLDSDPRKMGQTPLYMAIVNDKEEVAKFLIEQGANLEVRSIGHSSATLLGVAVLSGRSKMAKLLIEAKADLNSKDAKGNSILQRALLSQGEGVREAIRELVLSGADCICLSEKAIEKFCNDNSIFVDDSTHENVRVARKALQEREDRAVKKYMESPKSMALIPYTPPKTSMDFIESIMQKRIIEGTASVKQITPSLTTSESSEIQDIMVRLRISQDLDMTIMRMMYS